jgi:phage terminase small subunit
MLSPKQARFVAEYLKDLNAGPAAIRAGYSAGKLKASARSQGYRLLGYPAVAAAVAAAQAKMAVRSDVTAQKVIDELARIAFSDLRGLFDEDGNLKPIKDLTADQAAGLASLEVIKKNAQAGDGIVDTIHKLRIWDKTKALDLLARHLGLLREDVQHQGEIILRWAGGD